MTEITSNAVRLPGGGVLVDQNDDLNIIPFERYRLDGYDLDEDDDEFEEYEYHDGSVYFFVALMVFMLLFFW